MVMSVGLEERVSDRPPPPPPLLLLPWLVPAPPKGAMESGAGFRDRVIMVVVGWLRLAMVVAIVHQQ